MKRLLFLIISLCLWSPCATAENNAYQDTLIELAEAKSLYQSNSWHKLLHYRKNSILTGFTSVADDHKFFNAPDGKTNPKSELEATIRAFFDQEDLGDDHPQCRFVARFYWLTKELDIDKSKLPLVKCSNFDEWISILNPESLTLIFASAFLNNPASSFGHTLLRIDQHGQDKNSALLGYGLNYAAAATDQNSFIYAFKGIFGGYPGVYSVEPYYMKTKKYSDLEDRDIWEYKLNLSPEEVLQTIRHVWEVQFIYFDYYYFDENCSYQILSLLEVSNPDLQLTESFPGIVIPVDTVRAVATQTELIESIYFRAAKSATIKARIDTLPKSSQELALETVNSLSLDPLSKIEDENQKAEILDLSYDYLNYELLDTPDYNEKASEFSHTLLIARSNIPITSNALIVPTPQTRPDEGHETTKLRLSVMRSGDEWGQKFILRPAYHDLLDPGAGYKLGSQIKFFETGLRHVEGQSVELDSFTPLNILSLTPRSDFFKPLSWGVDTSLKRSHIDNKEPLVSSLRVAGGYSWQLAEDLLAYTLLEPGFSLSGDYRDDYSSDLRLRSGALLFTDQNWSALVSLYVGKSFLGDIHSSFGASIEQRFVVTKNFSIRFLLERVQDVRSVNNNFELMFDWYTPNEINFGRKASSM